MTKLKVTDDEKEDLADLMQHPGLRALLVECEILTTAIEHDVLRVPASDERKLVHSRSKGEGARQLMVAIRARVEALKSKANS